MCTSDDHLWYSDSDDEGRAFQACVRAGCPARKVTGTTATRW